MNLSLSKMLKQFRKDKNMTQEEVASHLGVTYQSVSRWENDLSYPDIELLPSIAALFDVSLDKLFGTDKESEEANVKKYDTEDEMLGDNTDERITLVKKYVSEMPKCTYFKFRLIELYHTLGVEFAKKKLDEMRALCRFIIDHTTDMDWYRDYAISYMIDAEENDRVDEWYSLLDNRSIITSFQAERNRYYYRGDVDNYNRIIQKHLYSTMTEAFASDFCKRDVKTYKNAQSRVDGQSIILKIIDAMRDPHVDIDAWVFDREFAFRRLAAGCFGAGHIEDGYAAMEKSVDLCLKLCEIPVGTELTYNSSVLDMATKIVEQEDAQRMLKNAYISYTKPTGWEWFNEVRDNERYMALIARLKDHIID